MLPVSVYDNSRFPMLTFSVTTAPFTSALPAANFGAPVGSSNRTSLAELTRLQSSEGALLCARGHVSGHPDVCAAGCRFIPNDGLVGSVVMFKNAAQISRLTTALRGDPHKIQPVCIENGFLIDGHHRVAAAIALGLTEISFILVSGILKEVQHSHELIRIAAFKTEFPR
jgi:hypothetical protein